MLNININAYQRLTKYELLGIFKHENLRLILEIAVRKYLKICFSDATQISPTCCFYGTHDVFFMGTIFRLGYGTHVVSFMGTIFKIGHGTHVVSFMGITSKLSNGTHVVTFMGTIFQIRLWYSCCFLHGYYFQNRLWYLQNGVNSISAPLAGKSVAL